MAVDPISPADILIDQVALTVHLDHPRAQAPPFQQDVDARAQKTRKTRHRLLTDLHDGLRHLPGQAGGFIIQVSLLFFALSTIISWSYYGECCLGYLTKDNKLVGMAYKAFFIFLCIAGATGSGRVMWDIADTLNILMAVPNLVALLGLSGIVVKMTRDYFGDPKRKLR